MKAFVYTSQSHNAFPFFPFSPAAAAIGAEMQQFISVAPEERRSLYNGDGERVQQYELRKGT